MSYGTFTECHWHSIWPLKAHFIAECQWHSLTFIVLCVFDNLLGVKRKKTLVFFSQAALENHSKAEVSKELGHTREEITDTYLR